MTAPSSEAVEAAARVLWLADNPGRFGAEREWDNLTMIPPVYESYRGMARALLDSSWRTEHDAEVRADAWDEGWFDRASYDQTPDVAEPTPHNPYRAGATS